MEYYDCKKGHVTKLSDYFNSTEFDCHGNGCCTETKINKRLIEYLDQIRKHFGKPIIVTSGYRCPVHNKRVGGATGSRHSKGDAADIVVQGIAPREVAKYAESIGILGIGLYETSSDGNFVHIDTRSTKSFWYGQNEQYRSTFGGTPSNTNIATNVPSTETTDNTTTTGGYITLKHGSSGNEVKVLQEKLINLGYSCGGKGADGIYGSSTANAVRKFQDVNGLTPDGIAGAKTQEAIPNAIATGDIVVVTASLLNVRKGAGTNYGVITTVKKDFSYTISEVKNGWGKLKEISGWVSLKYCKKIN